MRILEQRWTVVKCRTRIRSLRMRLLKIKQRLVKVLKDQMRLRAQKLLKMKDLLMRMSHQPRTNLLPIMEMLNSQSHKSLNRSHNHKMSLTKLRVLDKSLNHSQKKKKFMRKKLKQHLK